ncbi:hypothetical protein Tco_1331115, partial [Tanacetum coccineum]
MGAFHLYAYVNRNERVKFKRTRQPIPTIVNMNSSVSQEKILGNKSFIAAVQWGSHDTWSRCQAYVSKKNDNYVEKHATSNNINSSCLVKRIVELNDDVCLSLESSKSSFLARAVNIQIIHRLHSILEINGFTNFHIRYIGGRWEGIRVNINGKYYDVLIKEFTCWAPNLKLDGDCESNESSNTEQPVPKLVLEQSKPDPFNFMRLIENHGTNLVKKDKVIMINCDTDKVMEQPVLTENKATEFNKDQANQCQEGSSNEQRIDNNNMRNENTHTNITEIKEAMANNTINDGVEETKSSWPPGYTEYVSNIKRNKKAQGGTKCNSTRGSMESTCSMRFKFSEADFVRVSELGNIIGLEMPSSFNEVNRLLHRMSEINETFMKTDNLSSLRSIWGNSQFDYALVPSSGHSGGIVSIWNPYIFVKHKIISNPNVLIVQGRWLDVKLDIYMVNVYAPQDEEGKQNLWLYITEFMSSNPGHVPVGGYNLLVLTILVLKEVDLIDFLMRIQRGSPLTVVALFQTIFDHYPILFRRFTAYYGPIAFKIYHSLFQREGAIKGWVNGRRSRMEVINSLSAELRNLNLNIDVGQDRDENSKFFYGTLNKKRKQLLVRDIKSSGLWLEDPMAMVSQHELKILESEVSLEEIKEVVWDCGSDKSPRPDGFSFGFIKRYWNMMKNDIFAAISEFFNNGDIPIGCNASFITLIPKIESPLVVNDFRPISLIGILYKIIAKIISCRIALIIADIVDPVQFAFIKNRQILDGPMILNEVVHTLKRKKKKAMIFK